MNNMIALPNGNLIKRNLVRGLLSSSSLPFDPDQHHVIVMLLSGSVERLKADSAAAADELRDQIKTLLEQPLTTTEREQFDAMRDALETIAEQRVLVSDDLGETLADALSKTARRTLQHIAMTTTPP